jgi:hypothetical protein
VRFLELNSNNGPGIRIHFEYPNLSYDVGHCGMNKQQINMNSPTSRRVWTIIKRSNRLKLLLDERTIFEINYAASELKECRDKWSLDFARIKFIKNIEKNIGDTATDSFRPYLGGK